MPAKKVAPPASIYTLKISLDGIRPPIWRRVLVGDNVTVHKLHLIIQAVMGWEDAHMHQFSIEGINYGEPSIDSYYTVKDERRFALGHLVTKTNTKLKYSYDFGDDWQHTILVEEITPYVEDQVVPLCIKGKRAAPPEDIGGPWGYQALLEAKASIKHPERERFAALIAAYDPDAFDLDAINEALRKLR